MMQWFEQYAGVLSLGLSCLVALASLLYVIITIRILREMNRQRHEMVRSSCHNERLALIAIKSTLQIEFARTRNTVFEENISRIDAAIRELDHHIQRLQ